MKPHERDRQEFGLPPLMRCAHERCGAESTAHYYGTTCPGCGRRDFVPIPADETHDARIREILAEGGADYRAREFDRAERKTRRQMALVAVLCLSHALAFIAGAAACWYSVKR